VLAACGSDDAAEVAEVPDDVGPVDADPTVAVRDDVFVAEELVVEVGTEVTWEWEGRSAHDVVGDGFDSGVLTEGTFTHTFESGGSYAYTCRLHPGMDGVVHVLDQEG
jgi:plastocyanin